jgi:Flp pilus assembly protein TadG
MTKRTLRTFWTEDRAAISPLYAVGILTLVAVSGVGFDYGRLMALDSELQNAADQAALAAATQLDGGADAMARAQGAATTTFATAASAYVNETRFANDARQLAPNTATRPITSLTFTFYDGYTSDTVGNVVAYNDTGGAQAKVVEVTVNARQVFYALTPVVGAMSSGNVIGKAMAALESATCNVPPMMFCVPEDDGVALADFPTAADIGKGIKLHFKSNGKDTPTNPNDPTVDDSVWAPGNFGFLDIDYFPNGNGQNTTTGLNSSVLGCAGEAPASDPGFRTPQGSALNTRFDYYTNPAPNCDPVTTLPNGNVSGTGDFCPAENVRRDVINIQSGGNNVDPTDLAGLQCDSSPSNNWDEIADLPTSVSADDILVRPPFQSFPQDNCFLGASPTCDMIGNTAASAAAPNWDADAYMTLHHPSATFSEVAPGGTRYEVYNWEIANKDTALPSPTKVGYKAILKNNGNYDVTLYCAFPQPVIGTAVPASDTQKDRRILTVAAVDCSELNGKDEVKILKWVDLFLVQPVATTASDRNFFTEVIGPARKPNGDAGFQYFGRKKAVLIR